MSAQLFVVTNRAFSRDDQRGYRLGDKPNGKVGKELRVFEA